MINITDKSNCSGCTACASICTQNAISMVPDALGFKYPVVDVEKCLDCGSCDDVCAFNENYDKSLNLLQPDGYMARHKNISEIEASTSGAAFIAISDWLLRHDGVVYGAGYAEHFRVVHKRATTSGERDEFRGSKYVQSDLDGIFRQVKFDLESGRVVLFSGTPCQTAGLNSFIGKKLRENLYLVDLVCYGVPGPQIWDDYLNLIEEENKSKISAVKFRDMHKSGTSSYRETYKFVDSKECSNDAFLCLFRKGVMLRQSCSKCYFKNMSRASDITLGDFWDWKVIDSLFNIDRKGVSLILCSTKKGQNLFELIREDLNAFPIDLGRVPLCHALRHAITYKGLNSFEKDYVRYGIKYVIKKYILMLKVRKFIEGARSAFLYVKKEDGKHSFLERISEVIRVVQKKVVAITR